MLGDLTVNPEDHIVRRTTPNSFLRTDLSGILEKQKIRNLIICGYATEFCVDSTIRAAAALGYNIEIASDGHTTHDKKHASAEQIRMHHNETLPNIKSFGVTIKAIKTKEVIKNMS